MPTHVRTSLTVLILGLAGCGLTRQSPPTEAELAAAEYGPPPLAVERTLPAVVRQRYADRHVVQVEVGEPRRAWFGVLGGILIERDVRFGWAVAFRGYRLGFTQLEREVVAGEAFFRHGRLEGFSDERGFSFTTAETR